MKLNSTVRQTYHLRAGVIFPPEEAQVWPKPMPPSHDICETQRWNGNQRRAVDYEGEIFGGYVTKIRGTGIALAFLKMVPKRRSKREVIITFVPRSYRVEGAHQHLRRRERVSDDQP